MKEKSEESKILKKSIINKKQEKYFIDGVNPNQPDSFDMYEDVVDDKIKKDIVDELPSIEKVIDNKKESFEKESENEYRGPKSDEYKELTDEEIAERYPEYNVEIDTEGLRDSIGKAYEQNEAEGFNRIHESMNQRHKDTMWSDVPFQTRDKENANNGYAGKDNLKTLPTNKRQRKFRNIIKKFLGFQTQEDEKIDVLNTFEPPKEN